MKAKSDSKPVILVFGGAGQLGLSLACQSSGYAQDASVVVLDRSVADIVDADSVNRAFEIHRPALVINAAAYTAVDKAESEEPKAFAGNALGPLHLATACAAASVPLFHISTDYVFAGTGNTPWKPDDRTAPISVYGRSKLAGEWAVLATHPCSYIIRTSWVFSPWGNNFVKTMLRLGSEREELSIVGDQRGCPTYAIDLADALLKIAVGIIAGQSYRPGVYHFSNREETTWFDFAESIFTISAKSGRSRPRLRSILTADFPSAAARPLWSVMNCEKTVSQFDLRIPTWIDALKRCMSRLGIHGPSH